MSAPTLSRRERLRRQTLDEIKQHALAQVAEGGGAALSLNAIGKAMGMSGPAIYRYYGSREELLAALVTDGYAELAAAVTEAAAATTRRAPARRLLAIAQAYRVWALAHPYRYELLFGIRPEGYSDPSEAIATLDAAMVTLLEQIGEIAGDAAAAIPRGRLDDQLLRWAGRRADEHAEAGGDEALAAPDPLVLRLGVLAWTRLHGIVGLELAGVTADMGLDGRLLVEAEIEAIVAAAGG